MSNLAQILSVLGPLVAMAGALLAAWEVWLVPSWYSQASVVEARREMHQMLYDVTVNSYRVPPYSPEARDAAAQEAQQRLDESMAEDQQAHQKAQQGDRLRARRALILGLLLVAVGSLMQSVAALLT